MLLLLLLLLLPLLTCPKVLCRRRLCFSNLIGRNPSLTLQKDGKQEDEERGKEQAISQGQRKRRKSPRMTLGNPGVPKMGFELTLPFTTYKSITR